jgi:hypothetical protein
MVNDGYPLVNVDITMENQHCWMGTSTISKWPCSRAIWVSQRVYLAWGSVQSRQVPIVIITPCKSFVGKPTDKIDSVWQIAGRKTLKPTQWIHNFLGVHRERINHPWASQPTCTGCRTRSADKAWSARHSHRAYVGFAGSKADHLGHTWGPMFSWTRPHSRDMNSFKRLDGLPSSLSS